MKCNASQMPISFLYMQEDLEQDNGHFSVLCGNPYPIFFHIHISVVYSMYTSAHMFPCLQPLCALDHSLMHALVTQEL